VSENLKDNQNENSEISENQNEETPVIIYKKRQDYADYSSRYNFNSPEYSYSQFAHNEEKQVYRWNLSDEEERIRPKKVKRAKRNLGLKIFAGAMAVMFVFSALMSTFVLYDYINGSAFISSGNNFDQLTISVPQVDNNDAEELTVTQVISKIKPSVVTIEAEVALSGWSFWGRGNDPDTRTGIGTGFILSAEGYIATNYHVIEDATSLTVLLDNGRRYPAEVIGGDEIADLAIIKINARNLVAAELGNSDATQEGEFVVAIGSPGGIEFAGSSTFGIISGVNRDIEVSRGRNMMLLQTDASINPGNSGGPLVNMRGQVIGINTLKLASNFFTNTLYEGMGFSIPITLAVDKFNEILANPGEIIRHRSYSAADNSEVSFGISGMTVPEEAVEEFNVPRGVIVDNVTPSGSCGRAGIISGDIIIAIDGKTVETFEDLVELKPDYNPGDEAVIRVYRDGEELDFTIMFDARD